MESSAPGPPFPFHEANSQAITYQESETDETRKRRGDRSTARMRCGAGRTARGTRRTAHRACGERKRGYDTSQRDFSNHRIAGVCDIQVAVGADRHALRKIEP